MSSYRLTEQAEADIFETFLYGLEHFGRIRHDTTRMISSSVSGYSQTIRKWDGRSMPSPVACAGTNIKVMSFFMTSMIAGWSFSR